LICISRYRATFKILLLGDGAVGKTSVVRRFVHKKFDASYLMTIGMEPYTRYETINGISICYSLWDIAGQDKFRSMRKIFLQGASGTLLVFDLTRRESFDNVNVWYEECMKEEPDQVVILVGNKNDLKDKREVDYSEGVNKTIELGCIDYIETSALTGEKVEDAFILLGEILLKQYQENFDQIDK
jgi:Ras-related protein Rab-2A